MKLKRLYAFVGVCAAFTLVACGDSGSSSDASRVESYSVIDFDEQNRSFTFYAENKDEYCVLDETTKSASWKTIDEGNDTVQVSYDFVALPAEVLQFITDSLKVSVDGNTAVNMKMKKSGISMGLYVGGDASSIKGTWVSVPCDVEYDEVRCVVRDEWRKVTLKVSSSSIKAEMEYVYLHDSDYDYDYDYDYDDYDYYTDDLSKSEFLLSIFQSLYSRSYVYVSTGRGALENEGESIKAYANEYGITINSSSKSSVTFAFDNKTYELKAKDFELDKYDNALIDVTLSSGEKSCSYYSETGELEGDDFDRSACRSDLYEYYKTDDVEDYMGNRYVYGYEYRRNNSSEFESCVSEMIGLPTDSYGLYKKTAPKKSDEEIWSEYNHKMKMVQKLFK